MDISVEAKAVASTQDGKVRRSGYVLQQGV
jgi:hypothetical protein